MKTIYFILSLSFAAAAFAQDLCTVVKDRIDCHPDADASEEKCHARGCSWCPDEVGNPWCFVKPDHGYVAQKLEETPIGLKITLKRSTNASYFGNDAEQIFIELEFQSDERLRIKITNDEPRFEVPIKINPPPRPATNPLYDIRFNNTKPTFGFKVIRVATGTVLLDTTLGGLTFSDQFIQFTTRVPSTNVYGIGENEQFSFRHSFDKFATYALYGRDQSPDGRTNSYGVQPYYTVLEEDGNAHSVVIVNSNAQEFQVTPAPGLVYRTIGGIIDMYVFLGPTPENTVQQFTQAVGRQPMPPYWGLGFQLSRWGYDTLENMKAAIDRTKAANIPLDVQYGDIDIMDRKLDFTVDPLAFAHLPEFVKELKENGTKFIPIVDCGIPFDGLNGEYSALDLGNELDVWVKRPDGTPVVGAVWPGNTYYPDFSKQATQSYWTTLLKEFKQVLDYDGIWIDMNEPASWGKGDVLQGCANNNINRPPYVGAVKDGDLSAQTLCPDSVQEYGIHYNTHSLYAWKQSEVTFNAMRASLNGKRGMIVSRSNFIGIGKWATHWLGDNFSEWSDLRASIIGVLQYNQFGVPFVGADICGFAGTTTPALCQRWQQVGAFYPYSRNHNAAGGTDQDPGRWPEVAAAARNALEVRYTLLPTLYTLFYGHRTEGNTVVRALWHEFPLDKVARGIDQQFLWGSGILISPVLEEGVTEVKAYLPSASRWYDYYTGTEVNTGYQTFPAPLDFINVHIRGGGIYPTQKAALNTVLARQNPFDLIVALNHMGSASGRLFVDDGDSADTETSGLFFLTEFHASIDITEGVLTNKLLHSSYTGIEGQNLNSIRLFGAAPAGLKSVTVNGEAHKNFSLVGEEVIITELNLPLNSKFEIRYTFA